MAKDKELKLVVTSPSGTSYHNNANNNIAQLQQEVRQDRAKVSIILHAIEEKLKSLKQKIDSVGEEEEKNIYYSEQNNLWGWWVKYVQLATTLEKEEKELQRLRNEEEEMALIGDVENG